MYRGRLSGKHKAMLAAGAVLVSTAFTGGYGLASLIGPHILTKPTAPTTSAVETPPLTQTDLQPTSPRTTSLSPVPRVVRTSVVKADGTIIPRYVAPAAPDRMAEMQAVMQDIAINPVAVVETFEVTATSLHVRKEADAKSPIMVTVKKGSCLSVSDKANDTFYAVFAQTAEGESVPGYVHEDYIIHRPASQEPCFARLVPKR